MTVDFGFFAPAEVGNFVFKSCDELGVQNGSETPVEGATVSLTDAAGGAVTDIFGDPVADIITGADGMYTFVNLFPGEYKVTFGLPTSPSGLDFAPVDAAADDIDSDADPATGMSPVFTLESGESRDDIDAGLIDIEAPTFTVPADLSVECDGDHSPAATGDVTDEADNCALNLEATFEDEENFDQCGGEIIRTWTLVDDCGNETVQVQTITIEPAAEPTITLPTLPETLACDEAALFEAPIAAFSNDIEGTCLIEGEIAPVVEEDFTICGGTITITYTVPASENCERSGVEEVIVITVEPAPEPVITIPELADSFTCEEAAALVIPDATFTNSAADEACLIAGEVMGVLTEEFDECGGSFTITWTVPTGCDNNSVSESITIPVTPAAIPEIEIPTLPTELTCDEAAAYVAPDANFSNGATGTCAIEGSVAGVRSDDFTICGGTITITYTVDPGDNCEREAVVASQTIDVLPAPNPTIELPDLPGSLTCDEAANFVAPDASFSNGASDEVCLIDGTTPGVVANDFDQCGGEIMITWTLSTGCDNGAVTETLVIPVLPAPDPEIMLPELPTELTCDEAAGFVAPDASFSNGIDLSLIHI